MVNTVGWVVIGIIIAIFVLIAFSLITYKAERFIKLTDKYRQRENEALGIKTEADVRKSRDTKEVAKEGLNSIGKIGKEFTKVAGKVGVALVSDENSILVQNNQRNMNQNNQRNKTVLR